MFKGFLTGGYSISQWISGHVTFNEELIWLNLYSHKSNGLVNAPPPTAPPLSSPQACAPNCSPDLEAWFSSHGWCEQSDHPFLRAQVSLSLVRRRSMRPPRHPPPPILPSLPPSLPPSLRLSLPLLLWRFHRPFIWSRDGSNNISITLTPPRPQPG